MGCNASNVLIRFTQLITSLIARRYMDLRDGKWQNCGPQRLYRLTLVKKKYTLAHTFNKMSC